MSDYDAEGLGQTGSTANDALLRRAILSHISSGEAGRYNELYGGGSFDGFADHPRQSFPLANGEHTDAAGKYQFLSSTWDGEKQRLNLPDFSPASQDSAAWDLASRTYQNSTGRNILDDARSGKVDWGALGSQWTSLANKPAGGAAPASGDDAPVETAGADTDQPSVQPGGGGNTASPAGGLNALSMLQSLAPHLQFTPVDYDPFKVAAS